MVTTHPPDSDHLLEDQPEEQPPLNLNSQDNEELFYSLAELDAMEDELNRQSLAYGGTPTNPHMLLMPQQYRARLYYLDPETRWIDIGTGYFRILLTKDGSEHYMQIVSEANYNPQHRRASEEDEQMDEEQQRRSENGSEERNVEILHRSLISKQQDFLRQRDTIITWQDENRRDLALSFQEHRGAQNIWYTICFLKGIQISASLDEQQNI